MKTKDKLDELEAQLDHITNRIDNLRDEFVNHIEKESKFKKPLIKDEKIRKAVRAWADANDIRFGRRCGSLNSYTRRIIGWNAFGIAFTIEFDKDLKMYGDKITKDFYTIDELCGEDK